MKLQMQTFPNFKNRLKTQPLQILTKFCVLKVIDKTGGQLNKLFKFCGIIFIVSLIFDEFINIPIDT